jgi:membrane protein YdbS with pleckstrin-like domain
MLSTLTTKRSPIVLIRMLIIIEAFAGIAYFLAAALGRYEYEIYPLFSVQPILSFQTAKFLFLSGAQFFITIYAFLRWYRESYTVQNGMIRRTRGVFLRREKTFPILPSAEFRITAGPIGKWLRYGSIRINGTIIIRDISHPHQFLKSMEQAYDGESDLVDLLKKEENEKLEFKSSLRFDYHARKPSRNLERTAMKTIAAFLNSRGGSFIIGVNDDRQPIGLEEDYRTLQRKSRDGFEIHFTQLFNGMIGPEFRSHVQLQFTKIKNSEICHIRVKPSPKPVYFKDEGHEYFYMRTGNITASLKLSEIESYIRSRWPD